MAYCSQSDIEKLLPVRELAELTTESGDVPDAEVISACIAKADAEIDAYLGKRYQVPLAAAPAQVVSLAVDLAIYHLYSRRSVVPAIREQNYRQALTFLREVAAGGAVIWSEDGEAPRRQEDGPTVVLTSEARVFQRETLLDF